MKCLKSIILRGSCISLTLPSPRSSGKSSTYKFGSTGCGLFFDLFERADLSNVYDFEFDLLRPDLSGDYPLTGDFSSTSSSETASNSGN
jgi:hypothetical protein